MLRLIMLAPLLVLAAETALAQSSGRFHLVRSASGSKGAPDGGRFVLEDPRNVFQAGKDRQVMVTFEWQGPAGRHRCEGAWKDPSGKTVFTSEAQVDARGARFGVYWGLSLPDTVATGTWVVETRVDGELAGAHAFQVQSEPATVTPVRRPLAVAELYQRGLSQTLTLRALDATGAELGRTSGFFVAPDLVSTSFAGINAARAIRIVAPDSRQLETSEVVSWNRRDDWALLRFAGASAQPVERGKAPPRVGDRCFFLDSQGEGARVIVETTVIGQAGDELTLGDGASEASHGAPILDEYGDVVATLAGTGLLGATAIDANVLGSAYARGGRGSRARALAPATDAQGASKTLLDMETAGLFVKPLARTSHSVYGVLATGIQRQGRIPSPVNQTVRFSRSDGQCIPFVTWNPARKEDTTNHFELFDENNRRLGASEPMKTRLRPGEPFAQYWEIALASLKPGIYRIDLVLGPDPVWRTFFRVTD